MTKLGIFTGDLNFTVIRGIFEILENISGIERIIIVEQEQKKTFLKKIKDQKFNIKKNGWRWIIHILKSLFMSSGLKQTSYNVRKTGEKYTFSNLINHPSVTYHKITSINSERCLNILKEEKLDLGISLAAPILKKELFTLPRLGTINLHKGKLPDYKGMPAGYWEIQNNETEVGVTVHKINEGLDTGEILLESSVPVYAFSTAGGLRVQLDGIGIQLVVEAVSKILAGEAVYKPQMTSGHTYTKPTLKELSQEKKRIQRLEGYNFIRDLLKIAYLKSYVLYKRIKKKLPGKAQKSSIAVLLFHRVSDEFRDSVTIGVEQFDTLIGYLVKNYQMLKLDDALMGMRPTGNKPALVITFDDGYLDNYLNAAPILMKHGVAATFYISTDKITNNTAFDHDMEKLGVGLSNMTWANVRKMKEWGFDFGSHTVSHARLGKLDELSVEKELQDSLQTLKEELNMEKINFAYPYGGIKDFSKLAMQRVQKMGYMSNCSAYGGINPIPVNKWNIKRFGINYAMKIPAVISRIEGWDNTDIIPDWESSQITEIQNAPSAISQ